MSNKTRQPVRQAACLAAVAMILGTLSGCQGMMGDPMTSQVRIIDVSPGAPGLDIYRGDSALAYSLGFGTITSYVSVPPGTHTIAANSTGTGQVVAAAQGTFLPASQYTVLIGDSPTGLQQLTLQDQNQPSPAGQIAFRFVNRAARFGAVDIYLVPPGRTFTDVKPIVPNVILGANTGYLDIPTGTYTIVMLPAGTVPTGTTVPLYTGTQVTYSEGSAHTIILIDQRLVIGYGLRIISASDYDPPGTIS